MSGLLMSGLALADLRLSDGAMPQAWAGHLGGFCLLRIGTGQARLEMDGAHVAVMAGDLVFGRIGRRLSIADSHDLTVQAALFPRQGSGARLATLPLAAPLSVLSAGILGELLRAAVDRLDRLTEAEMRPLEIALAELVASALAANALAARVLNGSAGKNAIALRAMQVIELHLPDPDLSPALVAHYAGISLRYLQQLFEATGENANHLIRRRRLERCCDDLRDPLYADQSISAICFRWGFNDSAYFSRIFKDVHGVSPSAYRNARDGRSLGLAA
ncbi:helix-turn-helix domain-containing protein [Acidisoma cellulosilytica]|uniref:Helix-turn-helix domain-containing protein n=1 Tax=Acidisoma cellulosilyticum TaxID=2802395 RepID=A0A964E2E1_9PROT|nr:helix-turn-helix domain-containing protein [Acidisoma cellulosilyticum]MCB8879510.1 helix-turn-helix domain-containing protein [Acidisoma cellulosilyticum]